jgi:ketosteroid isomerase-like protein
VVLPPSEEAMEDNQQEFERFVRQQRTAAAQAYVNGDFTALSKLTTHTSPATFFGPMGGYLSGGQAVADAHERGAKSFQQGSETHLEILHMQASGELGYWVGLQHATVRMQGKPEPIPMKLRITELFRREQAGWKLIHRHADTLADEAKK